MFHIGYEVAAAILWVSSFQDPGRRSSPYVTHTILMAEGKRQSRAVALKVHPCVWHM